MTVVFTHKTDAMRRLLHLVSHGYTRYTSGTVDPAKVEALALKFADRYQVDATEMQRYRRKQRGEANAALVMLTGEPVQWWLLATPGEGLVEQLETLVDATAKKSRIELTGYELVKTPRQGRPAAWTWRMMGATYETWQERLRSAVRRFDDEAIRQALYSLRRVPGFSESRRQAFVLARLAKAEWQRTQKGEWPYAEVFVAFYGRYRSAETVTPAEVSTKARRRRRRQKAAAAE